MSEEKLGNRFNENKLRWRNFPLFLIRPLIEVAQKGELKYGTYNFLKGQTVNNCLDSAMRHLDSFIDPTQDDNDKESGISHLAHASWNLLVALYMMKTRPELDDRYKGEFIEEETLTPKQKHLDEALARFKEVEHLFEKKE